MPDTTTIAARIGLWSTRHRKAAVLGWLLLTLVAFGAGSVVGTQSPDGNEGNGESGRAGAILDGAFPDEAGESIIVQAPAGGSVSDPQVRSAVTEVAAVVRRQPTARYLDVARVSQDGRSQLVSFSLAGDGETTEAAVEPIVAAVERVAREHPGVYVGQFGAASAGVALSESLAEDFERAELLSLPLTLVILLRRSRR